VAEVELEQAEDGGKLGREARDFDVQDHRRQIDRQRLVVSDLERRVGELYLRAPVAGMVATIDVQDRDAVVLNAPILTIVDLSQFEVEAQIPETYAEEAAPGTPAVVTYGGKDYPAELTAVSPEVQAGQVQGRVKFKGGQPEGLRQSLRVSLRLVFEKRPSVLKLPRGPFLESGGGRRVRAGGRLGDPTAHQGRSDECVRGGDRGGSEGGRAGAHFRHGAIQGCQDGLG
jgi:HlyD family secretion protein